MSFGEPCIFFDGLRVLGVRFRSLDLVSVMSVNRLLLRVYTVLIISRVQ